MADANSLIMGNSSPSATFHDVGTIHEGIITALEVMQARKFGPQGPTNEPDFWKDGSPKMQAVITLKTQERDPEIENDNGVRRLFVGSKGMKDAIAHAVKKAGADGLAIGGTLGVKYTKNGEAKNAGMTPPKIYGAKYEPPPPGEEYAEPEPEDLSEYSDEPF